MEGREREGNKGRNERRNEGGGGRKGEKRAGYMLQICLTVTDSRLECAGNPGPLDVHQSTQTAEDKFIIIS